MLSSCSSASTIPSCPSELGTPSITLISRSLSSRFALSFYFQSLGTALSPGGLRPPKKVFSWWKSFRVDWITSWTTSIRQAFRSFLFLFHYPVGYGLADSSQQLLLATTSEFYLGLLYYWKGKQPGNQPIPAPPDANPLGLVSSASSGAHTPTASSFFTKKI